MINRNAFFIMLFALALAACGRQASENTAPVKASAAPASAAVKLVAGQVSVLIAPQGTGTKNASTGKFDIPVKVTNKGQFALSSQMDRPVDIGVQILPGNDGTGGLVDFARTPLPEVKPGQTLDVNVAVPVDSRVNGHALKIELVQEHVAWFASLGQPGIKVGPYERCGDSLCLVGQK